MPSGSGEPLAVGEFHPIDRFLLAFDEWLSCLGDMALPVLVGVDMERPIYFIHALGGVGNWIIDQRLAAKAPLTCRYADQSLFAFQNSPMPRCSEITEVSPARIARHIGIERGVEFI